MRSIANRLILFAAATLSLGTVAYAQNTLRANVPFAFQIPGGPTAAGSYQVHLENSGTGKTAQIVNVSTGHSVLAMTNRVSAKGNARVDPRLVFRCTDAGCQLSEIWTRDGGYSIPVSHVHDPVYVASIPLSPAGN
jgi:hypothetical protein